MKPTRRQRQLAHLKSSRKRLLLSYEKKGKKMMSSIWASGQPHLNKADADFIVDMLNTPSTPNKATQDAWSRYMAMTQSD